MDDSDDATEPGALHKARSLPRLNVEEAAELEITTEHAGHRYLTPQPAKRKPFIPPRPPTNNFRRSMSMFSQRQNGIPDIAEHEELTVPLEPARKAPPTPSNSMKNERLEEAKRDLVASSGPLTPKRKAPQPPRGGRRRRKSDTNATDLRQIRKKEKARVKSLGPLQGLSPNDSDQSSSSPDGSPVKRRLFYTPQPKRKQYTLDRDTTLDAYDVVQGSRSPVERLANLTKSRRTWGSSDSSDSTPSPVPQSVSPVLSSPRSPSSLSSQHSTTSSSTPPTASPKSLPISPLASPLKVTNTHKSAISGITWQTTVNTVDETHSPHRKLSRNRPSSIPTGSSTRKKPFRKSTSGSNIHSHTGSSSIRKGKHRSKSATISLLRSPDRSMDPGQAFGAAYQAENGPPQRQARRSHPLRDELLNSIVLNKTEQVTPVSTLTKNSSIAPAREEVMRTNNTDHENRQYIAQIARQKSGIEDRDGVFYQGDQQSHHTIPQSPSSDPSSPSSGYVSTPSPTSSPRHRPSLLRHMSSVSSTKSMKSIFGSREVLNDLFRSERGTNKGLKAVAGILTGLLLGVVLFIGLYYGLEYGLIAALAITGVSTLFMALALAFTVRGRCVALLMLPTLCTQRGRAAFLAIVVALLLNGPINNIFLNANEVSNSMSCSAELAYNQSQQIKEVAAEVFDQYVRSLEKSVTNLQDLADGVRGVFQPIEDGLDAVQGGLNDLQNDVQDAIGECRGIQQEAVESCNSETSAKLRQLTEDCKRALQNDNVDDVCGLFNEIAKITDLLCTGVEVSVGAFCSIPEFVDDAASEITDITDQFRAHFTTDINFNPYWDQRSNQSNTFESIEEAIEEDIDYAIEIIEYVFSIVDKLIALSVIFLLYRSYVYHTAYRTKDKFDNFYITEKFKELDQARKEKGKKTLLPLKKSEKVRLIDVTSFRLSKPEKGSFKIGMANLLAHICIATILILVDYGLYWLLLVIRKHGSIQVDLSGESGVTLDISGDSVMSNFIKDVFSDGFGYDSSFDISYDNSRCLPVGSRPNAALSVGIGICYLIAIFTVLFQAYALRLRRRIAAYFYPEREMERLYFIYNDTLKKRQTLFKFLKDIIKQKKKEHDATQRVSIRVFLAGRYPICKKIFKILHISTEQKVCFGCDSDDDGTCKQCPNFKCTGRYCEECLKVTNNKCTICDERFEDEEIYDTIEETRESQF